MKSGRFIPLACSLVALLVSFPGDARGFARYQRPYVGAGEIAELKRRILESPEVTVEHCAARKVPPPFATRRTCSLQLTTGTFERRLGEKGVLAFARRLRVSSITSPEPDPHARSCSIDSTRSDRFTLTFGNGRQAVRAVLDLATGQCNYTWRDSLSVLTFLTAEAADLRTLLAESLPGDTLIAGIVPCDPRRASPVPDRGESVGYAWVEQLPQAIEKIQPDYPDAARRAGVDGTVRVQALVDKTGTVKATVIVQSIPQLDEAVVASVEEWKFEPARSKEGPVSVWVLIPIRFTLH